jgi:hypothetical protein
MMKTKLFAIAAMTTLVATAHAGPGDQAQQAVLKAENVTVSNTFKNKVKIGSDSVGASVNVAGYGDGAFSKGASKDNGVNFGVEVKQGGVLEAKNVTVKNDFNNKVKIKGEGQKVNFGVSVGGN